MRELWEKKRYVFAVILILEAAAGIVFYIYGYHWLKIVRYLVLVVFLTVLAFIDYKETLIPNKILLWMVLIRSVLLFAELVSFPEFWKEIVNSAVFGFGIGLGIFLLAYVFSKKSIGLGDVKLAAVLGWYLGGALIWWDIVVCLALAGGYCIVQLFRKKLRMKDSIPLAPFFSIGTILVLVVGF